MQSKTTLENNIPLGQLNGHTVGRDIKEMIRRVTKLINDRRFDFETTEKIHSITQKKSFVTTTDTAAQELFKKLLQESFPNFGLIGEEDNLKIVGTPPWENYYITIDPIDGTSAFKRMQSTGVGTMLGIVANGEVIGAFIADVFTGELYYYRPGSNIVHRIDNLDRSHDMVAETKDPLIEKYVILRERVEDYSQLVQAIVAKPEEGGKFKNIEITGGSIGIQMARLWKNEVGAVILRPQQCTPWDWTPVHGINQKLGFVYLRPTLFGGFEECEIPISREERPIHHDVMIIHNAYKNDILSW